MGDARVFQEQTEIGVTDQTTDARVLQNATEVGVTGQTTDARVYGQYIEAGLLIIGLEPLTPPSISSAEAFGTPTVSATAIRPSSIPSAGAVGAPSLAGYVLPASISSEQNVPSPLVRSPRKIIPVGIRSLEDDGIVTVNGPAVKKVLRIKLQGKGIPSARAVGTPTIVRNQIYIPGISSGQAVGTPNLIFQQTVAPQSIASADAVGTPAISRAGIIALNGIRSSESFGTPLIVRARTIVPASIQSVEAFGLPKVGALGRTVIPASITSLNVVSPVVISVAGAEIDPYDLYGANPHWSLFLAYSSDIKPGTISPPTIAELAFAHNISVEMILNRPGACSFSMNFDDKRSSWVVPLHTCILAVRDGVIRWSGPVMTVDHDIVGNKTSVSAVGWLDLLERRKVRTTFTRPKETDDWRTYAAFLHMRDQIDTAGNPIPMPLTYGGHYGLPLERASHEFRRGDPMGSHINQLIEIESGYDIHVNPYTRLMTTWRMTVLGNIMGFGEDRPGALFVLGQGMIDNLQGFVQNIDGGTVANIINAIGPEGQVGPSTDDPASIAMYGAFEDDFSMSGAGISVGAPNGPQTGSSGGGTTGGVYEEDPDPGGVGGGVSDSTTEPSYTTSTSIDDVLKLGAAAEVAFRKAPRVTWQVTPLPWTPGSGVPRLFDDYGLGDVVRLAARRSWLKIPADLDEGGLQTARVQGVTVNIDENGGERIQNLILVGHVVVDEPPESIGDPAPYDPDPYDTTR